MDAADGGRARREFIRTHHPDVGGDPDTFVTGLAAFDRTIRAPGDVDAVPPPTTAVVVARARRRRRLVRRLDALARRLPGSPGLPGLRRTRGLQ